MSARNTNGRAQDRARVAGGQDHEVRYEAEKTGAAKGEVKDAVERSATAGRRSRTNWAGRHSEYPAAISYRHEDPT